MLSYKDKTFCALPNCNNECGRQITQQERKDAYIKHLPIAYAYFCGLPDEAYQSIKVHEAPE